MKQLSSSSSETPKSRDRDRDKHRDKDKDVRDVTVQSKAHIDRLLRSGSTYLNLNPFAVLQIEPETELDEIKKKYRRLSVLIHPDKNPQDSERAQKAFDIITKAWKILENEDTRRKCMEIIEEAKGRTDMMVSFFTSRLWLDLYLFLFLFNPFNDF